MALAGSLSVGGWANLAGSLAVAAALLASNAWKWGSLSGFAAATHVGGCRDPVGGRLLFCDAVRFYLPQGDRLFRSTERLEGFIYPPPFALLMRVVVSAGWRASIYLWAAVVTASTVALLVVPLVGLFRRRRAAALAYGVLLVGGMPILSNFYWGQVSVLITVLVLGALLLHAKGHRTASALLLGGAISIKVYPLIFVLPLLFKRDLKALARCAAVTAACMVLLPVGVLGAAATVRFYAGAFAHVETLGRTSGFAYYGPNVVSLLLTGRAAEGSALFRVLQVASLCLVASNALLLRRLVRAGVEHEPYWSAALLFSTLPFLVGTSWLHSYAWLPLVQAFAAVVALENRERPAARTALLLAPVIASAALSSLTFFEWVGEDWYMRKGVIFWSALLLLPTLHWVGWRTPRATAVGPDRS